MAASAPAAASEPTPAEPVVQEQAQAESQSSEAPAAAPADDAGAPPVGAFFCSFFSSLFSFPDILFQLKVCLYGFSMCLLCL